MGELGDLLRNYYRTKVFEEQFGHARQREIVERLIEESDPRNLLMVLKYLDAQREQLPERGPDSGVTEYLGRMSDEDLDRLIEKMGGGGGGG